MFSFTARQKTVEFQRYLRRMIDLTTPNKGTSADKARFENRHNRTIPVLMCPWENRTPIVSKTIVVVTKDIADQGVGVILNDFFAVKDVVVGFCLQDGTATKPWFFLGATQYNVAIGGGFWSVGVALTEFMNEKWHVELAPLFPMAQKLLPPQDS